MSEDQKPRLLYRDLGTDRIGVIRDNFTKNGRAAVWLRPPEGGCEWTAYLADLLLYQPGTAA